MGLFFERWYPNLAGLTFAGAYWYFCRAYRAPDSAKDLLAASISIGAIAVGFLANMKAILFTIEKKRIVQQLKEACDNGNRYYDNLVDYLLWAIFASTLWAVVSAAGIILDLKNHPHIYPVAVSVWIYAAVTSLLSYWRVVSLFTRILRSG